MKLLLDECAPRRLRNHFPNHEVQTVPEVGLSGVRNGELLRAAVEKGFEVFIIVDQRLRFQQNIPQLGLAVVILIAKPCRYPQLKPLVLKVLTALQSIKAGECVVIQ
jgi:predicted nuclease of predicted toxin-antitoxin system